MSQAIHCDFQGCSTFYKGSPLIQIIDMNGWAGFTIAWIDTRRQGDGAAIHLCPEHAKLIEWGMNDPRSL